jgi:hypothetical protein
MKFVLLQILIATVILLTLIAAMSLHGLIGILVIAELYVYYKVGGWFKKKKDQLAQ